MIELRGRERLFRARIEMIVLLLSDAPMTKLSFLSEKIDVHPSYLCRMLASLADLGLVLRPTYGRYSLQVPVGEFEWRWLEIPLLDSQPNVIMCQRLSGELEFRWCEKVGFEEPSWPWGDYILRASKHWSNVQPNEGSTWKFLRSSVVRAYRKVVSRVVK